MKALCYDCYKLTETRRILVINSDIAVAIGGEPQVTPMNLCKACADKRGVEDWNVGL